MWCSIHATPVCLGCPAGPPFLLQHVSKLGFCCSYDEVICFKMSVLHSSLAADVNEQVIDTVGFRQYMADNVYHNVCTVDGSGTFHGIGMVSNSVLHNGQFRLLQQRIPCLSGSTKTA
jgi:hypothetical protein